MKRVMQYKLCSGYGHVFEVQINRLLKEGWQPYGEPTSQVDPESRNIVVVQAMVKYKP